MQRKHFPFLLIASMLTVCIAAGCGDDEPETPTPPTPQDTTAIDTTDTIPVDTTDTIPVDTDTIVTPVDSTVFIKWTASGATVEVAEQLADQITYEVNSGNVIVTNTNVTDEFVFVLSGSSADGSFTYNGEYKATFQFNGLELTSTTGGAIDIQCGKRIKLNLVEGTTNTLADAATGEQKAAFNCQGHLEVSGGGTLNIAGNCNHALRTKEYLQLKSSTGAINITKAAADGIHCGEYFLMNGGTVNISGYTNDGLQMETSKDSDEPDNGIFTMNGGSIKVTHTGAGSKAIRADSTIAVMNINGGTIEIELTASASDAKGLVCDGNINISESSAATNITIIAAGNGYKDEMDEKIRTTGLKSDATVTLNAGNVTINATGKYARGMRASKLMVNGGTLTVTNTGSSSQGIKLDGPNNNATYYQKTGGTVNCSNWKY